MAAGCLLFTIVVVLLISIVVRGIAAFGLMAAIVADICVRETPQ